MLNNKKQQFRRPCGKRIPCKQPLGNLQCVKLLFKWEFARNELNLFELSKKTRSPCHLPPLFNLFANIYCMCRDYNLPISFAQLFKDLTCSLHSRDKHHNDTCNMSIRTNSEKHIEIKKVTYAQKIIHATSMSPQGGNTPTLCHSCQATRNPLPSTLFQKSELSTTLPPSVLTCERTFLCSFFWVHLGI